VPHECTRTIVRNECAHLRRFEYESNGKFRQYRVFSGRHEGNDQKPSVRKPSKLRNCNPLPPPSPSPSLFLSLAFVCSIDTRAESQAATSYRSPRSITYTTMLDVGLCDLWRCDGSIGDFSRRLPRPSRNSRTPREPLLALELGQFLCEGTPREALSLLRLGMARACHRTPINLGIRGASARQLGSSHDRFTARFTQRSVVARCHAPARELTDVAKAP